MPAPTLRPRPARTEAVPEASESRLLHSLGTALALAPHSLALPSKAARAAACSMKRPPILDPRRVPIDASLDEAGTSA